MAMIEEDDDDLYAPADTIPGLQRQAETTRDARMDLEHREEEMEEEEEEDEEEEDDDVSNCVPLLGHVLILLGRFQYHHRGPRTCSRTINVSGS